MSPEDYRYYRLDGAGRVGEAAWFEAENDADAVAQIAVKHPNSKREVWQGKRLVAAFDPQASATEQHHSEGRLSES